MESGTRANLLGLVTNVLLAVGKLVVGTLAGSAALVADGFNSAGDVVATSIGWVGYAVAKRPPDENHHYGHGNAESVAGLAIGAILLATGLFISIDGVLSLVHGVGEPPGVAAAWVAGATVFVKEGLYRYVSAVGRRVRSPSLLASARDHRADVGAALTVLAGVLAAQSGVAWLDPLAAMGIGLYIAGMSYEPIRENFGVLMDEAPPEVVSHVRDEAARVEGVGRVDRVRVHPLGSYFVVQVQVAADGTLSLAAAHELAHSVTDRVRAEVPHVRDVEVHVNPLG